MLNAESQKIDELIEISDLRDPDGQRSHNSVNLVGTCVDDKHPTLNGRVLVLWNDADGTERRRWLPTLQNLPVRKDDQLLLVNPGNWEEMIVVGVVDGYAKRPDIVRKTAAELQLKSDEAIRVTSKNGHELLELYHTEAGPVIRVLHRDTAVELPGRLKLAADSIELEAGAGPIHIKASDDVCINGELIHLN